MSDVKFFKPNQISKLLETLPVTAIILAIPNASHYYRREIVSRLIPFGIEIKTIQLSTEDHVNGNSENRIRFVGCRDFFDQSSLPPDEFLMRKNITGKVVLVTGVAGNVGAELCRQIIKYEPASLVLFDMLEGPLLEVATELHELLANEGRSLSINAVVGAIQDASSVANVLRAYYPETVYHCATYRDAGIAEENIVEVIRNNAFGTKVIVDASSGLGIEHLILISTDSAMRPCNILAASLRLAELIFQVADEISIGTRFSIVRVSDVVPLKSPIVSRIEEAIDLGGPVLISFRESRQYLCSIAELGEMIIQAGAISAGGEVFVVDLGEKVSLIELAKTLIRARGFQPCMETHPAPKGTTVRQIRIQLLGRDYEDVPSDIPLYGRDPEGTIHPKILKASDVSLSSAHLDRILALLDRACDRDDVAIIKVILTEDAIGFAPGGKNTEFVGVERVSAGETQGGLPLLRLVKRDE